MLFSSSNLLSFSSFQIVIIDGHNGAQTGNDELKLFPNS